MPGELESTLELASKFGISTVFAIVLLFAYIALQTRRDKLIMQKFDELKETLNDLKSILGLTVLTREQTTAVFRAVLNIHIRRKIIFAKQKLISNHIKTRRTQLEMALSSEFKKITQEEAQFLSTFSTPAGNIGYMLMEILEPSQWEVFMQEIFSIFFSESTVEQKLEDISSYMGSIVNDMILKIESKF